MDVSVIRCPECGANNRVGLAHENRIPVCGKCKKPLPWIVLGTDISFRKELDTSVPVLVDFWAEWCGPCRIVSPVLEDLARERPGRIKVVKLNIDHNPATAMQFNIQSIPTMILFKNGRAVQTLVGAMSKSAILQRLGSNLA